MGRPSTPVGVQINGNPGTSDPLVLKITSGLANVSAVLDDPDTGQKVRMLVRWSSSSKFTTYYQKYGPWGNQAVRHSLVIDKLAKNALYHIRIWAVDTSGNISANWNAAALYTDRYPNAPELISPPDNSTFPTTSPITFDWAHTDPDEPDSPVQRAYRHQYRVAGSATTAPGPWVTYAVVSPTSARTVAANTFKASTTYEWQVQTQDPQEQFGSWSLIRSFTMEGTTKPPLVISPASETVVLADEEIRLRWQFRDPDVNADQGNADVRYRAVGSPTWVLVPGSALTEEELWLPADTLTPGHRYEWQVQTYRASGLNPLSDWSAVGYFWAIETPGSQAFEPLPDGVGIQGALGSGGHRVFVFERGGIVNRGELTPIASVEWKRLRDDIAPARVVISGFDREMGDFLENLRTWAYELVVFRGDDRVFEGPITSLTYTPGEVVIGAKDVMAYAQRRILRQGYNDSYHLVNGVQYGLKTVVDRAALVLQNGLGYADPNVLPFLSVVRSGDDARQSRVIPDYTKLVWEEIDDMAANAGLDYTTVGRRIILWDTHNHIGVLPEMRDTDFSEPLTVSEYGMSLANYFAVTDGNGMWGAAFGTGLTEANWLDFYGPIEQLASGYGDSEATAVENPVQAAAQKELLAAQARRNVDGRWPAPLVARVPDNATISGDVNIGINQLVPGVWIPLRVTETVRRFAQMQKLDSVTVTETPTEGERVQVVMSPAPSATLDPDGAAGDEGVE